MGERGEHSAVLDDELGGGKGGRLEEEGCRMRVVTGVLLKV